MRLTWQKKVWWHQYVPFFLLSHSATILCVHVALYGTHWSRALECILSRCDFSAGPYPALRCFILIHLFATVGFYNWFWYVSFNCYCHAWLSSQWIVLSFMIPLSVIALIDVCSSFCPMWLCVVDEAGPDCWLMIWPEFRPLHTLVSSVLPLVAFVVSFWLVSIIVSVMPGSEVVGSFI